MWGCGTAAPQSSFQPPHSTCPLGWVPRASRSFPVLSFKVLELFSMGKKAPLHWQGEIAISLIYFQIPLREGRFRVAERVTKTESVLWAWLYSLRLRQNHPSHIFLMGLDPDDMIHKANFSMLKLFTARLVFVFNIFFEGLIVLMVYRSQIWQPFWIIDSTYIYCPLSKTQLYIYIYTRTHPSSLYIVLHMYHTHNEHWLLCMTLKMGSLSSLPPTVTAHTLVLKVSMISPVFLAWTRRF
jgi:hypothetical protein